MEVLGIICLSFYILPGLIFIQDTISSMKEFFPPHGFPQGLFNTTSNESNSTGYSISYEYFYHSIFKVIVVQCTTGMRSTVE